MGMLFSCENDLETINTITATDQTPDEIVTSFHTLYSDSGIVSYEIIAARMEKYTKPADKTIFKDGFTLNIFGGKDSAISRLTADYAEITDGDNMIVARNNVIFTNFEENQRLETEELFWDKTSKRVKTKKRFKVVGEKSTVEGYGLDTDENFTTYIMHKVSVRYDNDSIR